MGDVIPFTRVLAPVPQVARRVASEDSLPRRVPVRARPLLWRTVLGAYLRGERRRQERTLAEVAGVAGVSTQYLSEIERGRKEPSSEILGAVGQALGLSLLDLVGGVATTLGDRHPGGRGDGVTCLAA